jgi:hypothetical protein
VLIRHNSNVITLMCFEIWQPNVFRSERLLARHGVMIVQLAGSASGLPAAACRRSESGPAESRSRIPVDTHSPFRLSAMVVLWPAESADHSSKASSAKPKRVSDKQSVRRSDV